MLSAFILALTSFPGMEFVIEIKMNICCKNESKYEKIRKWQIKHINSLKIVLLSMGSS